MTSCTGSVGWGFLEFEKSQGVEFLPRRKKVDFRGPPRPDDFVRYGHRALVGLRADDVKGVSIERLCLSLSSYRKTFNSKVIKSFVPELRSRKVFFVVSDSLCLFHISVSRVCYTKSISPKVNIITLLGSDIAYFEAAVHHFNHYATGDSLSSEGSIHTSMLKTFLAGEKQNDTYTKGLEKNLDGSYSRASSFEKILEAVPYKITT